MDSDTAPQLGSNVLQTDPEFFVPHYTHSTAINECGVGFLPHCAISSDTSLQGQITSLLLKISLDTALLQDPLAHNSHGLCCSDELVLRCLFNQAWQKAPSIPVVAGGP